MAASVHRLQQCTAQRQAEFKQTKKPTKTKTKEYRLKRPIRRKSRVFPRPWPLCVCSADGFVLCRSTHYTCDQRPILRALATSVTDPDPNPDLPDPHVFGPPGSGSGSISQRYGSGSFYLQAKIVRKKLDYFRFVTSFWLFIFEKWYQCTFKK